MTKSKDTVTPAILDTMHAVCQVAFDWLVETGRLDPTPRTLRQLAGITRKEKVAAATLISRWDDYIGRYTIAINASLLDRLSASGISGLEIEEGFCIIRQGGFECLLTAFLFNTCFAFYRKTKGKNPIFEPNALPEANMSLLASMPLNAVPDSSLSH